MPSYSDGAKSGLPGDTASADPGPGVSGLIDADGTTALTPLIASPAPNATRAVQMSFSFQKTPDGRFLGFINSTSWERLSGTSTLLAVHQDPTGFVPVGVGIGAGDQLLVTEDSIQVLDVRVVRVLPCAFRALSNARLLKDNLDDGDHPFHLHGHRPWMYVGSSELYID